MLDSNYDVPDDLILKDILAVIDIATSGRYITLDDPRELDTYAAYLSYRVQQDLYKVCRENGQFCDLSWDEFVLIMRQKKSARKAASVAVRETLRQFCYDKRFDFNVTEVKLPDDIENGDEILHCARLFSPEDGQGLIDTIFFQAEVARYRQLFEQGKNDSWQKYLDKLSQKGSLWRQIDGAVKDALMRFDFKPVWRSEKLEELVNRAGGREV